MISRVLPIVTFGFVAMKIIGCLQHKTNDTYGAATFVPQSNAAYWVQYDGFRFLGVLDETGKWIAATTGKELADIVKVYPN